MDRVYWERLVDDYITAFRLVTGTTPTPHALLLVATPAEFETNSGRAWPGTFNFGAVQGRAPTPEERAEIEAGTLKEGARITGAPGYVLHVDTDPVRGPYFMWFAAFTNQRDGVAHYLRTLLRPETLKVVRANGTLRELALAMYLAGYYVGKHPGARYYTQRKRPLLAAEQANIDDYANALERVFRQTIEPNMSPIATAKLAEPPPMPTPTPTPVTPFAKRVATIARKHQPCSARVNQPLYIEAVVRPADRTPARLAYYINDRPSTCGLFACETARAAGLDDTVITTPYKSPPGAVADLQVLGEHHKVLERGTPTNPFREGDIVIIDEIIYRPDGTSYDNPHVVVCVADATVTPDGAWSVPTCEGGQSPDSTGVAEFIRAFVPRNNKRYLGGRYVIATLRLSRLDITLPSHDEEATTPPEPPPPEPPPLEPVPEIVPAPAPPKPEPLPPPPPRSPDSEPPTRPDLPTKAHPGWYAIGAGVVGVVVAAVLEAVHHC